MQQWLQTIWHKCQTVGTWIKGNWILLLLVSGMIFGILFAKNKSDLYNQLLTEFRSQQTQNAKELEDLRKVQQNQLAKQQDINRKYEEVLDKIQRDYQDQVHLLGSQKQEELKRIISVNHDDPSAMAHEINGLFNIPIYTVSNS